MLFYKFLKVYKLTVSASGFRNKYQKHAFVRVLTLAGEELLCCATFGWSLSSGRVGMVDGVKYVEPQRGLIQPHTAENDCFKLAWRHKHWEALWSTGCVRCQKYKSNPFKKIYALIHRSLYDNKQYQGLKVKALSWVLLTKAFKVKCNLVNACLLLFLPLPSISQIISIFLLWLCWLWLNCHL